MGWVSRFVCSLSIFFASVVNACQVVDDTGAMIELKQPAQRIVSLAPDITEHLFAIGAGNHIVGVVSGSDYPEKARFILRVGSYRGIDLERIILLHPDLIVAWGQAFLRQLAALKKIGIPVYITQPQVLEDVPRTMRRLGCLTGTSLQANREATHFTKQLQAIKKQYQHAKPLRVFYQVGEYSLFTINHKSWIHQALALCGGKNIFADAKSISPEVTLEAVVQADPDVIISDVSGLRWKKRWEVWPQISAVKYHSLFNVSPDLLDRAGPRLVEGVAQLCQLLVQVRNTQTKLN